MTAIELVADIRAAQNGDAEAWARLLHTYRPAMDRWSHSFSTNNELSQRDLIQDAWMQVFKGLDQFAGVDQAEHVAPMFYSWLKVTSRNAMLTTIKSRQAQIRNPGKPFVQGFDFGTANGIQSTPSSIVARDEQLELLALAVNDLPDLVDRQIVEMVSQDGLSLRNVAKILDRDYSTVRRRFHKVLEKLQRHLDN